MMILNQEEQEWILENTKGFFKNAAMLPRPYFLTVPETIVCKDGQPKKWFISGRKGLEFRDQFYMNLAVIKNYLLHKICLFEVHYNEKSKLAKLLKGLTKQLKEQFDLELIDKMSTLWDGLKKESKTNANLWMEFRSQLFVMSYKQMIKIVPSKVIIFLLLTNRNDFFRNLQKIIYLPCYQNYKIFDCFYNNKQFNRKVKPIAIRRLQSFSIMPIEELDQEIFEHKKKPEPALTFECREELTRLLADLSNFIQNKFGYKLSTLRIYLHMQNGHFSLLGLSNLQICNSVGLALDPSMIHPKQVLQIGKSKCGGIYCGLIQQGHIYDDADLQYSLLELNEQVGEKKILFKSIILDIVENIKTRELISKAMHNLGRAEDEVYNQLLMKYRRYYSIADLFNQPSFSHMKSSLYFKRVNVCNPCFQYYKMVDWNRAKNFKGTTLSEQKQLEQMTKQMSTNIPTSGSKAVKSQKLISPQLRDMVHNIGKKKERILKDYKVKVSKEGPFIKTTYTRMDHSHPLFTRVIKRVRKQHAHLLGIDSSVNLKHTSQPSQCLTKSLQDLCKLDECIKGIKEMQDEEVKEREKDLKLLVHPYMGNNRFEPCSLSR